VIVLALALHNAYMKVRFKCCAVNARELDKDMDASSSPLLLLMLFIIRLCKLLLLELRLKLFVEVKLVCCISVWVCCFEIPLPKDGTREYVFELVTAVPDANIELFF
jgi:hypothetical protein